MWAHSGMLRIQPRQGEGQSPSSPNRSLRDADSAENVLKKTIKYMGRRISEENCAEGGENPRSILARKKNGPGVRDIRVWRMG